MTDPTIYVFEENGGHFCFSDRTVTKGMISPMVSEYIELVPYKAYEQALARIAELEEELKQAKGGKDAMSAL